MIKYDNCKNCVSLCEYAGKDREFVCPGGVSCKQTQKPTTANGPEEMFAHALRVLDVQRLDCIEHGAEPGMRWFPCYGPGDLGQNCYYNGHMNMMDAMLLPLRKTVVIDENGRHHIKDLAD